MSVYFITLAAVCFLCYYAEGADWPEEDEYDKIRFHHTSDTLFYYFIALCVLVFVAGFRYYIGSDYGAYYNGYVSDINELSNAIKTLKEPGFGFLARLATFFYDDGIAVIFMASLVTIVLSLTVIYRYSDTLLLPIFLYITMGCWSGSFNGVRQYLAASVLVCGYKSLRDKKLIEYCIIVFLAFLFHRSAIVFLFLYYVVNREINIPNIIFLVVVVIALYVSYESVFSFANFIMNDNYTLNDEYTSTIVNRLRILAACVPSIVFLYAYRGIEKNESTTFALNIIILRTALSVLAMNSALLYRITIYMSLFAPLAISELLKGLSEKNRNVITGGLVIMYLVMWLYELHNSSSLTPFQWIWSRTTL